MKRAPGVFKYRRKDGSELWGFVVEGSLQGDGSRRQIRRRGFTHHDAARDAQAEKRKDLGNDTVTDPGKLTLSEYLRDEWLPTVSKVSKRGRPLAPTTMTRYADAVKRIVKVIGKVKLSELRARHVERLRDALLDEGTLAPQSVGDILRVLSQALRRATARGLVARNVADADMVDRPAGRPAPFTVIDRKLGQAILEAVRGTDPWDAATHLALGVTLRREEVLGLRWSDVDTEAGTLSVRQAVTFADKTIHFGEPKSSAGERTVQLPGFVLQALRRHRVLQAERRLLLGEAWRDDHDLVVDRGDGGPWSPPSFSTGWARFAARHGFGHVTFHGLRHGAATLLLAAGVSDAVAVHLMGHADTRILRRYQGVVDELLRDAAVRMDATLGHVKSRP